MAYNFYPSYYPPQPQLQPQPNNGFVYVRSETEARNYPVGYGNTVNFKDESAPFLYTKTMGYSQLEPPRFEKYKRVDDTPVQPQTDASTTSDDKTTINDFLERLKATEDAVEELKKEIYKTTPKKKKEVVDDPE